MVVPTPVLAQARCCWPSQARLAKLLAGCHAREVPAVMGFPLRSRAMSAPLPQVPEDGYAVAPDAVTAHPKPGYALNRNRLAPLAVLATLLCGALPGFILGVMALVQIHRRGQQGKGQAWTAVILSSLIMLGAAVLLLVA